MISVTFPKHCSAELDYTLDVLLGDFLGLDWQKVEENASALELSVIGSEAKLTLSTDFFEKSHHAWLSEESMPDLPLKLWHPANCGLEVDLIESTIPVIYGEPRLVKMDGGIHLNLDIFGSEL